MSETLELKDQSFLDSPLQPRQVLQNLAEQGWLEKCYPLDQNGKRVVNPEQLAQVIFILEPKLERGTLLGVLVHLALFTPLLIRSSNSSQLEEVAEAASCGKLLGAVATTDDRQGGHDITTISASIDSSLTSLRISGNYAYVTNGQSADWFVVLVRSNGSGPLGLSLYALPAQTKGINITPQPLRVMIGAGIAKVTLTECVVQTNQFVQRKNLAYRALADQLPLERLLGGVWAVSWAKRSLVNIAEQLTKTQLFQGNPPPSVRTQLAKCISKEMSLRTLCMDALSNFEFDQKKIGLKTTVVKVLATELLESTMSLQIRLAGGRGFNADTSFLDELADARVFGVAGGPWDVLEDTIPEMYLATFLNHDKEKL